MITRMYPEKTITNNGVNKMSPEVQPPRGPESYAWLTYAWVIGLSAMGGAVAFYRKMKKGHVRAFNVAELIGECVTSAFAGVLTFYLCEATKVPQLYSAAVVGIAGHMGSRAINLLEMMLQKKFGVELDDEPEKDAIVDQIQLRKQLEVDEGKRKRIYIDTLGLVTGGIGRNLTNRAFSDDEIELMYTNDVKEAETQLDRRLPWWRQMNDARQNVLMNMCFNMGIDRLLGFTKTLELMKAGRYDASASEMLNSKWAVQVGDRAGRLADVMRKGEF